MSVVTVGAVESVPKHVLDEELLCELDIDNGAVVTIDGDEYVAFVDANRNYYVLKALTMTGRSVAMYSVMSSEAPSPLAFYGGQFEGRFTRIENILRTVSNGRELEGVDDSIVTLAIIAYGLHDEERGAAREAEELIDRLYSVIREAVK